MAGRGEDERGGYTSFADAFDGGGAGRSGSRFEGGGVLSDVANMVATPRSARGADTGQVRLVARPSMDMISAARSRVNAPYSFGRDLLDGGGLGRRATLEEINAGRGFRGGVPSMVANMFGIRPMGANDLGLVASYDAALASRPDISGQMGLLNNVVAAQGAQGVDGVGGVETENFDVGYNEYVEGLGSAAEGATQDELRQGYTEKLRLLGDAGAAVKPYGTMVTNAGTELDYGMPAGLLGQVQGEAAVQDTIAQQIYDNDTSFLNLDDARALVADPVAYQSYIDSRR